MKNLDQKELRKDLQKALRNWSQTDEVTSHFLDYLYLVQNKRKDSILHLAVNQTLVEALELLEAIDSESASLLRLRYLEGDSSKSIAIRVNRSVDQVNRLQRKAVAQLSTIIFEMELEARDDWITQQESQLPPKTYDSPIGIEKQVQLVTDKLKSKQANVIAISGLAGSGKTTLAQETTRHLIRDGRFDKFVWLEIHGIDLWACSSEGLVEQIARQLLLSISLEEEIPKGYKETLQQLQTVMKDGRFLIVIDGLKIQADPSLLFSYLDEWGGSSKFLLTTRKRIISPAKVFWLTLGELNYAQSKELIRKHVAAYLPELLGIIDDQAMQLYDVVGGNPLAIKLALSLAAVLPFDSILQDLREASSQASKQLYRRIYNQVWNELSENAKKMLMVMPLTSDVGASLSTIENLGELDHDTLFPAIKELVSCSLLEVIRIDTDVRYSIHPLTRTFLRQVMLTVQQPSDCKVAPIGAA